MEDRREPAIATADFDRMVADDPTLGATGKYFASHDDLVAIAPAKQRAKDSHVLHIAQVMGLAAVCSF